MNSDFASRFRDPEEVLQGVIEKETKKLYHDNDDQCETVDFYDSFNDPDWRKPRNNRSLPSSQFRALFRNNKKSVGYPPDWRTSKVAAKHLKYCPGDNCRVWLQLHHFATNYNMEDGLDIYCIECNNRKKNEKYEKKKPKVTDKFVDFCEKYETDERYEVSRRREIYKRIKMAAIEAKGRFKQDININPDEIIEHIFEKNSYKCGIRNEPLTTSCFLDHHQITFEVRLNAKGQRVLDVICSDCE